MAPKAKVNTSESVNTDPNASLATEVVELEKLKMELSEQYAAEEKVTVSASPMYAAYFGNNMPIIINGIAIYVPLNGQRYNIPESFAAVFFERIAIVEEQIRITTNLSNVQKNSESFAGEKDLISRA